MWVRRDGLGIADVQAAVCCRCSTTPLRSEFAEVSFKLFVSSFWTLIRKRKQLFSAQKSLSDWPKYVKWLFWFPSSTIHSIFCVRVLVIGGICPGWVTPTQAMIWESPQIILFFSHGKFIAILDHTALYRAGPFLLTIFQPKRQLLIWVHSKYFCLPPPPQNWRKAELYENEVRTETLKENGRRCRGPRKTLSRKWAEGSSHESLKP